MDLQTMKSLSPEKQKELFDGLTKVRKKAKTTTYSATYGVGKAKLARTAGISEVEAKKLLEGFWKLNWAVEEFSKSLEVKTVGGQMWVKNPVSGFWYALRYEKDKFSTVNQSTGAYCFDTWVAYYLTKRPNIVGQFHDESVNRLIDTPEERQAHTEYLKWAIGKVNEKLKLNIDLDVDVQFGSTYAQIH